MAILTRVVAYDVADNNRRARVAALLQTHGDRIQQSVYLLTIEPTRMENILDTLRKLIDTSRDNIYVFSQCADCWTSHIELGLAHPPRELRYWCIM